MELGPALRRRRRSADSRRCRPGRPAGALDPGRGGGLQRRRDQCARRTKPQRVVARARVGHRRHRRRRRHSADALSVGRSCSAATRAAPSRRWATKRRAPDYAGVAAAIEERWSPGDVVVDASGVHSGSPDGLDVYLPQTHPEIRLGLPISDKPFLPFDPVPPLDEQIDRGDLARARADRSSWSPTSVSRVGSPQRVRRSRTSCASSRATLGALLRAAPRRLRGSIRSTPVLEGVIPLRLFQITDRRCR